MEIIIDRKKKRFYYGLDSNWNDPLGLEKAQKDRANTIEIDKNSTNIIDKYLIEHPNPKDLLGKKIWAMKDDKSKTFCGWIVDVYPSRILLCNCNGENIPIRFIDVISMEK